MDFHQKVWKPLGEPRRRWLCYRGPTAAGSCNVRAPMAQPWPYYMGTSISSVFHVTNQGLPSAIVRCLNNVEVIHSDSHRSTLTETPPSA